MFFIFGFGHRKFKKFGALKESCLRCNNYTDKELIKATSWFTLFFIPIIPYSTKYFLVCPVCREMTELSKEEFFSLAEGGQPLAPPIVGKLTEDDVKYAGKTPTQINYLKQMEAYDRARQQQE